MPEYELDKLSWYNFERLAQVIIKAEFGAIVESTSGYQDRGKDAYCATELRTRTGVLPGPVVFQAKFVHAANAAGAKYWPQLLRACENELELIHERMNHGTWARPKHYFLLTNCHLQPSQRLELNALFQGIFEIGGHYLGGQDFADLLDLHPTIARQYPEILSYRHLLSVLADQVHRGLVSRSEAAINEARNLLPIFSPTAAYRRAWEILRKHDFVVLTGPPEMGKTAIGRMIAMAQFANGWEVVDCYTPDDLFDQYLADRDQVFLADDAFGRTEYDATRGALWEAHFSKVRQKIDKRHWLIWTSRKHILEGAMRQMDIQGSARGFPQPAEVIVQADWLSPEEKGQILFRHAINADLSLAARAMLKDNLTAVIYNAKFTPERIRRLTSEALPALSIKSGSDMGREQITEAITAVLERPTEMMEKAYAKLEDQQKWVLVTLLDEDRANSEESVEAVFKEISPIPNTRTIHELLSELDEGFIRISSVVRPEKSLHSWKQRKIDWVHPSYRDLIIDQLMSNRPMRLTYLRTGGVNVITLAISQVGGTAGERRFPLLPDLESWEALSLTVEVVIKQLHPSALEHMLTAIAGSLKESGGNFEGVKEFAETVCAALKERWDSEKWKLNPTSLKNYYSISLLAENYVPSPALHESWAAVWDSMEAEMMSHRLNGFLLDGQVASRFAETLEIIYENEPRFLKRINFDSLILPLANQLLDVIVEDISGELVDPNTDVLEAEEQRLEALARAARSLISMQPKFDRDLANLADEAEAQARHMGYRAQASKEGGDDSEQSIGASGPNFDPRELFREFLA